MTTTPTARWRYTKGSQINKGIGVWGPQATDSMYGTLPLGSLPNDLTAPLVVTGETFYSPLVTVPVTSQPMRPGPTLSMLFHHHWAKRRRNLRAWHKPVVKQPLPAAAYSAQVDYGKPFISRRAQVHLDHFQTPASRIFRVRGARRLAVGVAPVAGTSTYIGVVIM